MAGGTDEPTRVAVGLGSNLGDRLGHLRDGVQALRGLLDDLVCSGVYETAPKHDVHQPPFLNACCVGRTRLTARQLLTELQHAERSRGRRGGGPRYGPRVLDLDLLLYGDLCIREPGLVVPHPRLREREFVLVPLREIAADWWVPVGSERGARTVGEWADAVGTRGVERTHLQFEDD